MKHNFILFLSIVVLSGCTQEKKVSIPPNIVFILADDLGYAELGCYGQEKIQTPNIDQLASNGMKFSQFYSGAPVCAPARCVLLTGKHAGHTYIRGNDEWRERGEVWDFAKAVEDPGLEGQRPIPDSLITVAELLQTAGYTTACVGKWGLGAPYTEGTPNKQGFDFFYGYNCQRQAHTYCPKHLWKNEEKIWLSNDLVIPGTKLDPDEDPMDDNSYARYSQPEYAPDLMIDETLAFLEENSENPFFLYFATPIPHVPLQAPDSIVNAYRILFGDEEPYLGEKGYFPNRTPRATYAAMVTYLDYQVGQIVDKLKELGVYDNTVIFFTSDNGPSYAGGADSQFFDSAAPFRSEYGRGKGFVYEGGIRVPLVVQWPGKIPKDSNSDHIGAFYDILPTLCELGEVNVPYESDGISMMPSLINVGKQKIHEFLYWEFPSYEGQQAVLMGKWKGIRRNIYKGNMDIELYNLENDILEEHDVSEENPDVLLQVEKILESQHEPSVIQRFQFKELGDK